MNVSAWNGVDVGTCIDNEFSPHLLIGNKRASGRIAGVGRRAYYSTFAVTRATLTLPRLGTINVVLPAHICWWLIAKSRVRSRSGTTSAVIAALLTAAQRVYLLPNLAKLVLQAKTELSEFHWPRRLWTCTSLHLAYVHIKPCYFYNSIGEFSYSVKCHVLLRRKNYLH